MGPTQTLTTLVDALADLPSIGRKTAEKLAYHLLKSPSASQRLVDSLEGIAKSLRSCTQCFNYAEGELCSICLDASRDASILCVVTTPKDLVAIESTGSFKGLYHVVYDEVMISVPVKTLDKLKERLDASNDNVEVILATNPDSEGDALALEVRTSLSDKNIRISQLARGISTGSNLEFLRRETLAGAITNRQTL